MKSILFTSSVVAVALGLSGCAIKNIDASFSDPKWDGKTVPKNQVCKWAGGNGATPKINISNISPDANVVLVEFSDRTYKPMDKGGHGKIGMNINNQSSVTIPSIPGETSVMPENMFIYKGHKGLKRGKAGAYLPPCSGGKGNNYYATIKTVKKDGDTGVVLQSKTLEMGKF
jgi:Tfp pilus assembly protein PilX